MSIETSRSSSPEYRFQKSLLGEIVRHIDDTVITIRSNPKIDSVLGFYTAVASAYADETSRETQQMLLEVARGGNKQGKKALLFLNMKSILAGVSPYLSDGDTQHNDDVVQQGIVSVLRGVDTLVADHVASTIFVRAQDGAIKVAADNAQLSYSLTEKKGVKIFQQQADRLFSQHPYGLTKEQIGKHAQEIADTLDVSVSLVRDYLNYRNETLPVEVFRASNRPPGDQISVNPAFVEDRDLADAGSVRQQAQVALLTLDSRASYITASLAVGKSQSELAAELHLRPERVRQLKEQAYKKMRRRLLQMPSKRHPGSLIDNQIGRASL